MTTSQQIDDKQKFDDCALRVIQVGKLGQIKIQAEDPNGNKRTLWVDREDLIPARSTGWSTSLDHMLSFFETLFERFPPLVFKCKQQQSESVLVYTDASRSPDYSGIGAIVMALTDGKPTARFMSSARLPEAIVSAVAPECGASTNHLELYAILCTILTYPDLFRARHVLFFVDNTSAMSAAIHGYTASPSFGPLSNAIRSRGPHCRARLGSNMSQVRPTQRTSLHGSHPSGQ